MRLPSHPLIEPLEARIAPASIVLYALDYASKATTATATLQFFNAADPSLTGANFQIAKAVNDNPHIYFLKLSAGEQVEIPTAVGIKSLVNVTTGTVVAFFNDPGSSSSDPVAANQLTGLSLGNKVSVAIGTDVNGSIVTNYNDAAGDIGQGSFTGILPNTITKLTVSGSVALMNNGSVVGGGLISGGAVSQFFANGNVNEILTGTAANGFIYSFDGGTTDWSLSGFAEPAAAAGPSLSKVTLGSASVITLGNGGPGAKGASLNGITFLNETNGCTVTAGNGGAGAAGGSITGVVLNGPGVSSPDTTPNSPVVFQAGAGGTNAAGHGGAAGSVKGLFVDYNTASALNPSATTILDDVSVFGGAGGNGLAGAGGAGGSLEDVHILTTTMHQAGAPEFQLLGGAGGTGTSGGGAGGSVTKSEVLNLALAQTSLVSGLPDDTQSTSPTLTITKIQGGAGGLDTLSGPGGAGGAISGVNLKGYQFQLLGGSGGQGGPSAGKGGAGGAVGAITVEGSTGNQLSDNYHAESLSIFGGDGGKGTAGSGGAGGAVSGVSVTNANFGQFFGPVVQFAGFTGAATTATSLVDNSGEKFLTVDRVPVGTVIEDLTTGKSSVVTAVADGTLTLKDPILTPGGGDSYQVSGLPGLAITGGNGGSAGSATGTGGAGGAIGNVQTTGIDFATVSHPLGNSGTALVTAGVGGSTLGGRGGAGGSIAGVTIIGTRLQGSATAGAGGNAGTLAIAGTGGAGGKVTSVAIRGSEGQDPTVLTYVNDNADMLVDTSAHFTQFVDDPLTITDGSAKFISVDNVQPGDVITDTTTGKTTTVTTVISDTTIEVSDQIFSAKDKYTVTVGANNYTGTAGSIGHQDLVRDLTTGQTANVVKIIDDQHLQLSQNIFSPGDRYEIDYGAFTGSNTASGATLSDPNATFFVDKVSPGDFVTDLTNNKTSYVASVSTSDLQHTLTLEDPILAPGDLYQIIVGKTKHFAGTVGTVNPPAVASLETITDPNAQFISSATPVQVGDVVVDTTAGTTTKVAAVLSDTVLQLQDAIFSPGDFYTVDAAIGAVTAATTTTLSDSLAHFMTSATPVQVGDVVADTTNPAIMTTVTAVNSDTQLQVQDATGFSSGDNYAVETAAGSVTKVSAPLPVSFETISDAASVIGTQAKIGAVITDTTTKASTVITQVISNTLIQVKDAIFAKGDKYTIAVPPKITPFTGTNSGTVNTPPKASPGIGYSLMDASGTFLTDNVQAGDLVVDNTTGAATTVAGVVDGQDLQLNDYLFIPSAAKTNSDKYSLYVSLPSTGVDSTGLLYDGSSAVATFVSTDLVGVGDIVKNTTTNASTVVTAVLNDTQLALAQDIFATGDSYQVIVPSTPLPSSVLVSQAAKTNIVYDPGSNVSFKTSDGIQAGDLVYDKTTDPNETAPGGDTTVQVTPTDDHTLQVASAIFNPGDSYDIVHGSKHYTGTVQTLTDSTASFGSTGANVQVGDTVRDVTHPGVTTVASVIDNTDLGLKDSIFHTGDTYEVLVPQTNKAPSTYSGAAAASQFKLIDLSTDFNAEGIIGAPIGGDTIQTINSGSTAISATVTNVSADGHVLTLSADILHDGDQYAFATLDGGAFPSSLFPAYDLIDPKNDFIATGIQPGAVVRDLTYAALGFNFQATVTQVFQHELVLNSPIFVLGHQYDIAGGGSFTAGAGGFGKLTGAGGAGGGILNSSLDMLGAISMTAGAGGPGGATGAAGAGGSLVAPGSTSTLESVSFIAGAAGSTGGKAGAGGSITKAQIAALTDVTLQAGDGTAGGAGGSISKSGFSGVQLSSTGSFTAPSGNVTVAAGNGGGHSLAGIAGAGGSISYVEGFVSTGDGFNPYTTSFTAGNGGGGAGTIRAGAGGSVSNVNFFGGGGPGVTFTIDAGDAGNAPLGTKGATGGSVTDIGGGVKKASTGDANFSLNPETNFHHIIAGDGGSAGLGTGGLGGSVSNVFANATIGVRSGVAFGFNVSATSYGGKTTTGGTTITDASANFSTKDGVLPGDVVTDVTTGITTVVTGVTNDNTLQLRDSILTAGDQYSVAVPGGAGGISAGAGGAGIDVTKAGKAGNVTEIAVDAIASIVAGGHQLAKDGNKLQAADLATKVDGIILNGTNAPSLVNTFQVALGGDTSVTLPTNATPGQVALALNQMPSIQAAGGVTVPAVQSKNGQVTGYTISFNNGTVPAGLLVYEPAVEANGTTTELVAGFANVTDGSGNVILVGKPEEQAVKLALDPSQYQFTLSFSDGHTTFTTPALGGAGQPVDPATVMAALNALPSIQAAGGVSDVELGPGPNGTEFDVTFTQKGPQSQEVTASFLPYSVELTAGTAAVHEVQNVTVFNNTSFEFGFNGQVTGNFNNSNQPFTTASSLGDIQASLDQIASGVTVVSNPGVNPNTTVYTVTFTHAGQQQLIVPEFMATQPLSSAGNVSVVFPTRGDLAPAQFSAANFVGSVENLLQQNATIFTFTHGGVTDTTAKDFSWGDTPIDGLIAAINLTSSKNFVPEAYLTQNAAAQPVLTVNSNI